jgi:hypothetical protein
MFNKLLDAGSVAVAYQHEHWVPFDISKLRNLAKKIMRGITRKGMLALPDLTCVKPEGVLSIFT